MTPVQQTFLQRQSAPMMPSDPEAMHVYAQHMSALEQHRAVEAHQVPIRELSISLLAASFLRGLDARTI
jgi:hypothetical protein